MPNRMYEKGARREREIVNKFKGKGNYAVRTAGSHSNFDVIAIEGFKLRLIQVKGSKMKITPLNLPSQLDVFQELWYKKKGKWIIQELKGQTFIYDGPKLP